MKRKECYECEWMKDLEDSEGRIIYYCMDTNSGAYGEETGICGNCEMEVNDDDEY